MLQLLHGDLFLDNFAETAAESIVQHLSGNIENIIETWFFYEYDGYNYNIDDGGDDMYDDGNMVTGK